MFILSDKINLLAFFILQYSTAFLLRFVIYMVQCDRVCTSHTQAGTKNPLMASFSEKNFFHFLSCFNLITTT